MRSLGLVRAQPEQLRRREPGQRAVAGQRDQPLEADPPLDLRALGGRALVVPEDRGRRTRSAASSTTSPCIWPEKPDRPSGSRARHACAARHQSSGILLRPARLRRRERVVLLGASRAARRPREIATRLDAGRADVKADQGRHAPARRRPARRRGRRPSPVALRGARRRRCVAATPSMKRHCSTERLTAPTASSV